MKDKTLEEIRNMTDYEAAHFMCSNQFLDAMNESALRVCYPDAFVSDSECDLGSDQTLSKNPQSGDSA